jgi:glycosyltransferase involved in cell wall biosynthesis
MEETGDHGPQPLIRKMGLWAGRVARWIMPRRGSWQSALYEAADLVLPNSNAEAQAIMRQFRLGAQRIHVVPHGVDPRLAEADPELFAGQFGVRDFVLYSGAIEPGNHQLGFLWAMSSLDVPVIVHGDARPGCSWYLDQCRRAAGGHVQFVPQLGMDDPLLASAYTACGCLVVSGSAGAAERIALAAGVSGSPLVLFEGGRGNEYFGHQAVYVQPDDVAGMRRGVLTALARKRSASLAEHVRTYFSWQAVAKVTREAYAKVLLPFTRRPGGETIGAGRSQYGVGSNTHDADRLRQDQSRSRPHGPRGNARSPRGPG